MILLVDKVATQRRTVVEALQTRHRAKEQMPKVTQKALSQPVGKVDPQSRRVPRGCMLTRTAQAPMQGRRPEVHADSVRVVALGQTTQRQLC